MSRPLRMLERFVRASRAEHERCNECGAPIPSQHRHIVDVAAETLLCICRGCALFDSRRASDPFKLVPENVRSDSRWSPNEAAWNALGIPVTLAFIVYRSARQRWVAYLPSPFGVTQAEPEPRGWAELAQNALVRSVQADVEALLVRSQQGKRIESYVAPIDVCYELSGVLRRTWRGMSGGDGVKHALAEFFARLERRSEAHGAGGEA